MENRSVKAASLLLLFFLTSCSTLGHQLRHLTGGVERRLADDVVIERDEWGVPHVRGGSDEAVAFGVAWAMAEDNFWQVEESYIEALGRSAYYYGVRYLADDLVRAAFRSEALARAEYARASPEHRQLLDAFAHGLNYYLRRHPETPARVITHYEGWMVLARARQAAAAQLVGGMRLGVVATLLGEGEAAGRPAAAAGGAAWAVAASRSASGRSLLLGSVQAPFFGSEQPYELELHSESGWRVYGLARLGTPFPFTGHNERLAWAHAPAAADTATLHRVLFGDASDSLVYRMGERSARAEVWVDTILVNTAAGVQPRVYRFVGTEPGPVLARRGDTAFVAQLPGFTAGGSLQQWEAMGRARTLQEFTAALAQRKLPGLATVYADVDGAILAHAGGEAAPVVNPAEGVARMPGPATADADSGWTVARLAALALGRGASPPRDEVALLVHEWEQVGGRDTRRAFAMDSAVELLRRWDGGAASSAPAGSSEPAPPDSSGGSAAVLYQAWQQAYRELVEAGAAAPYPRFRALEEAVARVRRDWGAIAVPWGQLVRLQRRHSSGEEVFRDELPSVAVSGVPNGSLFVLGTVPGDDRRRYATAGTAAVLVTELTTPPQSRSIVVFGQSADPGSPHFFDQAGRYAAGELKPAGFLAGAVRERYHPGQRARVLLPETGAQRSP